MMGRGALRVRGPATVVCLGTVLPGSPAQITGSEHPDYEETERGCVIGLDGFRSIRAMRVAVQPVG